MVRSTILSEACAIFLVLSAGCKSVSNTQDQNIDSQLAATQSKIIYLSNKVGDFTAGLDQCFVKPKGVWPLNQPAATDVFFFNTEQDFQAKTREHRVVDFPNKNTVSLVERMPNYRVRIYFNGQTFFTEDSNLECIDGTYSQLRKKMNALIQDSKLDDDKRRLAKRCLREVQNTLATLKTFFHAANYRDLSNECVPRNSGCKEPDLDGRAPAACSSL